MPVAARRLPARAFLRVAFAPLLLVPAALRAQHAEVGVFTAVVPSIGGSGSPLYGASMGGGAGVGMRVSGGVRGSLAQVFGGRDTSAVSGAPRSTSGWMVDMDLTLDTRNNPILAPMSAALLGFAPMVFAGAGAMGLRDEASGLRAVPVFSYGGGVSRSLFGGLGVTTEARWRGAVRGADGSLPEGLRSGWEYRAGLALRFGGPRAASPGRGLPRIPWPGGGSGASGGSARAAQVIDTADDHVGVRYVYGGTTPRGFDCSGLVQYAFSRHGVRLPRTSRQQAQVGRALPASVGALEPGDLVFFSTEGDRIDHVAIYAGRNRILHSSSSGGGVLYDDLGSRRGQWFVARMVAARRVVDGGGRSFVDAASLERLLAEAVTRLDAPDGAPRR